jgi:hypothetical protein
MEENKWINEEIKNKYDNSPFRVPLRNREGIIVEYALVDKEDYEKVMGQRWSLSKEYARASIKGKIVTLHHFVFKKPDGKNIIDHINRDNFNNKKKNLREVSKSFNSQNKNISKNTDINFTSEYIGVSKENNSKYDKKYRAMCQRINLGSFENEIEAAIQYDKYTYKIFGENAYNNRLIKYEDVVDINIDEIIIKKKERELPLNIKQVKDKFLARRVYRKKTYSGKQREFIEDAQKDLIDINKKIIKIEEEEELQYLQKPIIRNNDGIAIIKVKDIEVLVDDDMWHKLNKVKWWDSKGYYSSNKYGLMHRFVINAIEEDIVDHINVKKYDNRKNNLRIVSDSINNHNKNKQKNCSSIYIGVTKHKNKWLSRIKKDHKDYHIGVFQTELEAAQAYNEKAIELYEDCAKLNTFHI